MNFASLEHLLATTSTGGFKQFNLRNGAVERQFIVKDDPTICIQRGICIGEKYFYFVGLHTKKSLLYFWDLHKKESIFRQSLPEKIVAISFCRSGVLAFAGSENGTLFVWQVNTGRLVNRFKAHFSSITHLHLTSDNAVLFTASTDADMKAYNLTDLCTHLQPFPVRHYKGHSGAITAITGSYDGPFSPFLCFLTASVDCSVMCWSWESERCCAKFLFPNCVNCLVLENTHALAFAGCEDGCIYILTMEEAAHQAFDATRVCVVEKHQKPEKILRGHSNGVKDLVLTYDLEILASCASDGIRLWHLSTHVPLKHITFIGETITSLSSFHTFLRPLALPTFPPFQRTFLPSFSSSSKPSHSVVQTEETLDDFYRWLTTWTSSMFDEEEESFLKEVDENHFLKFYTFLQHPSQWMNSMEKDAELTLEKMKNEQLTTLLKAMYSDSR